MALSFVLWHGAQRPDVLVSDTGTLVGVMTSEGRALSKPKGAGFVARNWLENDGTGRSQQAAAELWHQDAIVHLSGKRAMAGFKGCTKGHIVVASTEAETLSDQPCLIFDPKKLKETGSLAISNTANGWQITTARAVAGDRLWTNWPKARNRLQYVRIKPTKRP